MRQFKNIIYTKPHFLLSVTTCWCDARFNELDVNRSVEISSSDNIVSFFLSILVISSDWCLKYQVWSVHDSILFCSLFQVTAHFLSWISDELRFWTWKPLIFFLECLPKLNFWKDYWPDSCFRLYYIFVEPFSCVIEVFFRLLNF